MVGTVVRLCRAKCRILSKSVDKPKSRRKGHIDVFQREYIIQGIMDFVHFLTNLISNPEVQSFMASCALDAAWEKIKEKLHKEPSWDTLSFCVIRDTFALFYDKHHLEYDETIVMDAFINSVRNRNDFDRESLTPEIISDTIGFQVSKQQYEEWINIFTTVCSNPKYQWVYNKLTFHAGGQKKKARDTAWMEPCMQGNFCEIECHVEEELESIFDHIATTLPQSTWLRVRGMITEVIYNVIDHGQAQNCTLVVKENEIAVVDDGKPFDVLALDKQERQRGGASALKLLRRSCPDISLSSEFVDGKNHFTIQFAAPVFDVNEMSEILVLDLTRRDTKIELKYPKGDFRYYFIDVRNIPKTRQQRLFATMSGMHSLLDKLKWEFQNKTKVEKIFIYCPKTEREDYQYVYETIEEVLHGWHSGELPVPVEQVQ